MKKYLFLIIFFSLITPVVASAANAPLDASFNPLCWQKKECDDTRAKFGGNDKTEGWVAGDPCNKEGWGRCLPVGKSVTEISFGGKKEFANIGEFIKTNYNLGLTIAGILALIMIVVAGVQWTTSGGNSEMISGAKKRITGALTGLLIAYLSYVILNTVNPAMVNLRLPQIWMIRQQVLATGFCDAMPTSTKFAVAAEPGKEVNKDDYTKVKSFDYSYNPKDEKFQEHFKCGNKLFFEGGVGQTCTGQICPQFQVCTGDSKMSACQKGVLAIKIAPENTFGLVGAPVVDKDNNAKLMMMCNNGAVAELQDINVSSDNTSYVFGTNLGQIMSNMDSGVRDECGLGHKPSTPAEYKSMIAGFYIGLEVNDETGLTGAYTEGAQFAWGVDDWHAVGKSSKGVCDVNLAKYVLTKLTPPQDGKCIEKGNSHVWCSCSTLDNKTSMMHFVKAGSPLRADFVSKLISYDELFSGSETGNGTGGYACTIKIERPNFPAVDNSLASLDWSAGWGAVSTLGVSWVVQSGANLIYAALVDPTACH